MRLSNLENVEAAATVPVSPGITRLPATQEPPTPIPSPTMEPPEEVEEEPESNVVYAVTYIPPTPVLNSAGLGQIRAVWEVDRYITAVNYYPSGSVYYVYDNQYDILYADDRVWEIRQSWDADDAFTAEAAETNSRRLIPADSRLVETYSPPDRPNTIVNLYHSRALEHYFYNQGWPGGIPGDFIVQYDLQDYGVSAMRISLGNNP